MMHMHSNFFAHKHHVYPQKICIVEMKTACALKYLQCVLRSLLSCITLVLFGLKFLCNVNIVDLTPYPI